MSKRTVKHIVIDTPQGPVTILLSQVRIYTRKSTKGERAACSLSEQAAGARRRCERLGFEVPDEQLLEEAPGTKGHHWWEGGQPAWRDKKEKTRPMLTKLVRDVMAGRVRLIVVWDFSRLWRHTGICDQLVDLFGGMGVLLADRNGLVDISSSEGRSKIKAQATQFQQSREGISESTNRALDAKRGDGEAVALGRYMGYHRVSKGKVDHDVAEIALVRRIFTMFAVGEQGGPPMGTVQIAKRLTEEGQMGLFPESRYGKTKREDNRIVGPGTLRRVLDSPRYIGMQWKVDEKSTAEKRRVDPTASEVRDLIRAQEFLIDKRPAVDPTLWHAAQAKLCRNRHIPRRRVGGRSGSGVLRCGVCAKTFVLTKGPIRVAKDGREVAPLSSWRANGRFTFHGCDHAPCPIPHQSLVLFFRTQFAKVLKAELRRAHAHSSAIDVANRIAELQIQRGRITAFLDKAAEDTIDNIVAGRPTASSETVEKARNRLYEIDAKLLELKDVAEREERSAASFDAFDGDDEDAMRETLRSAIVWAAVVPAKEQAVVAPPHKGPKTKIVGHVLFLTAWRTYHTAVVEERVIAGRTNRRRPTNVLRLLSAEDGLGTIMNLPEPKRFYENLVRGEGHLRTRGPFRPESWAPGYGTTVDDADDIEGIVALNLD